MDTKNLLIDIQKHLRFTDDPEEFSLDGIMTLGDDWDDPIKLGKALDMHPVYEAKYAKLLNKLETNLEAASSKLKAFESYCKGILSDILFYENRVAGMTANQAKPSIDAVKIRYETDIVNGDESDIRNFATPVNIGKMLDSKAKIEAVYDTEKTYGDCHKQYRELEKEVSTFEVHRSNVSIIVKELNTRTAMLKCSSQLVTTMIQAGILKVPIIQKTSLRPKKDIGTH